MDAPLAPPRIADVLLSPPTNAVVTTACALAAGAYLVGVFRLRRRGHSWPARRTASWLAGCATAYAVSGGGFAPYAMALFSAHMIQHMVLSMYVPIMLVLAAPVTLLLRALPARGRAAGIRRLVVRVLHSRPLAVLVAMPTAVGLFVFSLFGLYFTPLLGLAMSSPVGHLAMQLHFLLTGYLFFWMLIGADPGPRRPSEEMRLGTLIPMSAVHGFFAVLVSFSGGLLAEDYFAAVRPGWTSLREQQAAAGGLAGGMAEVPLIVVAGVLLISWFRRLGRTSPALPDTLVIDPDVPALPQDSRRARRAAG